MAPSLNNKYFLHTKGIYVDKKLIEPIYLYLVGMLKCVCAVMFFVCVLKSQIKNYVCELLAMCKKKETLSSHFSPHMLHLKTSL